MSQSDLFAASTFSVSELTQDIKTLLEGNFMDVKVEGEVSNASTSRSGHTYFTLKDEDAQLSCVIWRGVSRSIDAEVVDGQHIIAGGDIEVYPPHGKYQLIVRSLEQAGKGALQEAFEKLKNDLKDEGLFDDEHKKALPPFPFDIGVITSATGAAFHDIRDTLERRWPLATVHLHHASVQGVNAAPELVRAINFFSNKQNVDLLIVGRGGGSLEDLWPFNEEAVARALFDCKVPTISAVGHEVDFSISDFVADARAATPTQAAIVATPDVNEIRLFVDDLSTQLQETIDRRITNQKERVQQLVQSHALMAVKQKVTNNRERLQNLTERLQHRNEVQLMQKHEKLNNLRHRLELQNPNTALEQGYSRIWQEDGWVKSLDDFDTDEELTIEWKDGKVELH
ncbi:Exodeoxyribonuclease VII large subunit [Fodinibius salinus]|uniref:Exodeoxyribonuclease 7 large subunit n=1 Tax=Fodinibius salinus TaxID=860790 RepID=A0A5D3YIR0_9BACT|nr:exodeoxyribonuclease VII large subunit [Fodinibius salinus]TYP92625.1 Exodeoxyribonuclease VII large subunit [Fodinibius salinus]